MKRRRFLTFLLCFVLCAGVLSMTGCGEPGSAKQTASEEEEEPNNEAFEKAERSSDDEAEGTDVRINGIKVRAAGPFVLQNADAIREEYPDTAIEGLSNGFVAMLDVVETEFVVKVDGDIGSDDSLSVQFLDTEAEPSEQIQAIREFKLKGIPKGAVLKFTTGGTDKKLRIDEDADGKTDRVMKTNVNVLNEYNGK